MDPDRDILFRATIHDTAAGVDADSEADFRVERGECHISPRVGRRLAFVTH